MFLVPLFWGPTWHPSKALGQMSSNIAALPASEACLRSVTILTKLKMLLRRRGTWDSPRLLSFPAAAPVFFVGMRFSDAAGIQIHRGISYHSYHRTKREKLKGELLSIIQILYCIHTLVCMQYRIWIMDNNSSWLLAPFELSLTLTRLNVPFCLVYESASGTSTQHQPDVICDFVWDLYLGVGLNSTWEHWNYGNSRNQSHSIIRFILNCNRSNLNRPFPDCENAAGKLRQKW